jgi:hypothetical protein
MMSGCLELIKKQLKILSVEVIGERVYDPQDFIRK